MRAERQQTWIHQDTERARELLLKNVSPPGAIPGAIVASPSRSDPDYYFHWVRDSGIAVKAVLSLYQSATQAAARQWYLNLLMDFVNFSRHIQRTAARSPAGQGEPKFTIDGEPYSGPWGRPQNDGPAIRAIELTRLAFVLLNEGKRELVREKLYDAKLPTDSVIKTDLEYISHHWREPCFDVWEEVWGHHFFTRLLERTALVEGAALATRLEDAGAARWYLEQSRALGDELFLHWDPGRNHLVATRDQDGWSNPRSGLDSSVIVATLGGYATEEDFHLEGGSAYPVDQEQVLATAAALERTFEVMYPINDPSERIEGIAIGRYPEDRYDGYRTDSLGNPWPSLTIAFAAYYYKLAERYLRLERAVLTSTSLPFFERLPLEDPRFRPGEELLLGDPRFDDLVDALRRKGDAFLGRVHYHINPDGSLSEQMNRTTGYQQGAPDLSMNYAAYILAAEIGGHPSLLVDSRGESVVAVAPPWWR
ncbi:glycoside hydrolase family 15 protein [Sorangium sp. So ce1000]|uniref:glycoside hydrolase family 15 protein n=1 Tax=Sorangium sp. So ce1000 TaxID=3133325 RepID=UPI003F60671A